MYQRKRNSFLIPTTLTLTIINLVNLAGNSLVIIAVITTTKLRTNTNTYIVSLACSDILLGIFVIPFSASLEILTYWPFGVVWCSIRLAIDVLICTASILNLLAINFDRYLAVTKPIQYASAMSRCRSKVIVTFAWLLSFVISILSLVGWNDKTSSIYERRRSSPFIYAMNKRSMESRSLATVPEGRHSNRIHIRKILKETKATKTVAIIVGVFTMCWLPFFTMYIIEAFWGTRVPLLAFSNNSY
ncbi:putative G-protein coupled receptor No9 [Mytilus galloprovincialis]|uniref:putative G-protein coupled receptor No9 n=1 Tax=Mytilus galloprovincialis TaxID=29158 RepID=UPI003F7C5A29